jgi:hypothetical protein
VGIDAVEACLTGPLLCEEGAGKRREGLDRATAVDACGAPRGVVCGASTARDARGEMGMVLELSAPGREAPGETGQVRADERLVLREAFAGRCRGLAHGRGGEGLRRADAGAAGCRDRAGAEAVRPGELCVTGLLEPLRGAGRLTLGPVPVPTCGMDAVLCATVLALREAVAIRSGAARQHGAHGLWG